MVEKIKFRHRLSYRQARNTVIVALMLGISISIVQISYDYINEKKQVDSTITQVVSMLKESAALAAWDFDVSQANMLINGLFEYKPIYKAKIAGDFGKPLAEKERNLQEKSRTWFVQMLFEKEVTFSFPLYYRNKNEQVGSLTVSVDTYLIAQNFIQRSGIVIVSGIVRNIILAFILTYIFYFTLTRPLLKITKNLSRVNPNKPIDFLLEIPKGQSKSEMGLLVKTTNKLMNEFDQSLTKRRAAEKQVHEREVFIRSIMDSVPDGILTINETQRIEACNPEAENLFQYPQNQLIGLDLEKLFREMDLYSIRTSLDEYFRSGSIKALKKAPNETQIITKNKEMISTEIRFNEMTLQDRRLVVCVVNDIRQRKQVEAELEKHREKLEEQVAKRTKALKESFAILETTQNQLVQSEKMAALGGLVAGVAHEINTPVGVGVTAASFLEDATRELLEKFSNNMMKKSDLSHYIETANESSQTILSNLNKAAELIRSFKQVAVDQSGEKKRQFNLKSYVDEVLLSLRPKYKRTSHKIVVDCPDDLEIESYPGTFSQIITNLVVNSLVHGFDGVENGNITINFSVTSDKLFFLYNDNGIGMDLETKAMIFDPFFTTKRGQGGTGLGMHIVYNIVTQTLGGEIDCDSIPNKGTFFTIRIPLSDSLETLV